VKKVKKSEPLVNAFAIPKEVLAAPIAE